MTKPKSIFKECWRCHSSKVKDAQKMESSSFDGWRRAMHCLSCGMKWQQLFYRGNLLRDEER